MSSVPSLEEYATFADVADVIEVHCQLSLAGDQVEIGDNQFNAQCTSFSPRGVARHTLRWATPLEGELQNPQSHGFTVPLDEYGNATVIAWGEECLAGTTLVSAHVVGTGITVQAPFTVLKPVGSSNEAAHAFPAAQVKYKESVATIVQVEFGSFFAGAEVDIGSRELYGGCLFTSWIGPEGVVLAGGPLARAPEAIVKLDSEGRAFLIALGTECAGFGYFIEANLPEAPFTALYAELVAPEQPPLVTALRPNHGPSSGGTLVTISGRGFDDGSSFPYVASEVYFGAARAANVTVNSTSSITAEAPPGVGTVDVTVRNHDFPHQGTSPIHPPDQYTYVGGSLPSPPPSLSVSVNNGDVAASWKPPKSHGGLPLTQYVVDVTPVSNNRVPQPSAPAVTETLSPFTLSTVVQNLVADCHQTYTLSVAAENAAGQGAPVKSAPFRPSGIVRQNQEPPYVVLLVDGILSHSPAFTMNPYQPTTDGKPSYCPEAFYGHTQEAKFIKPPNGPYGFFHKWNYGEIANNGNPKPNSSESTPRTVGVGASGQGTHSFMLDALAGQGAIILPFGYTGAGLAPPGGTPTFVFYGYSGLNSNPQTGPTIQEDAGALATEVTTVEKLWPSTEIVVMGHSQGGLIAWTWWQEHRPSRPVKALSLDSPINGVCVTILCLGPPTYPEWEEREEEDPKLLALDDSEADDFRFVGTWGDPVEVGPAHAYGTGPETLEHQQLFSYSDTLTADQIQQDCPSGSNSHTGCPAPEPPDHISECPITSNDPSWEQKEGHFVVKFCPGDVAFFNGLLGLSY
jgi:hypothetical protein